MLLHPRPAQGPGRGGQAALRIVQAPQPKEN